MSRYPRRNLFHLFLLRREPSREDTMSIRLLAARFFFLYFALVCFACRRFLGWEDIQGLGACCCFVLLFFFFYFDFD